MSVTSGTSRGAVTPSSASSEASARSSIELPKLVIARHTAPPDGAHTSLPALLANTLPVIPGSRITRSRKSDMAGLPVG